MNEIGSSKQLLHERLKLKDEDVESKINDLLAQQHLFVDIIRELESLLVKKNHLLGNQYDIHVRQVSDLKGLIDVYRSELKYRDDLLSITLYKPILSGLRNNDINEENKSLRYDCEDLKTRLSYQIEENGILKSRIGELQAICDSINTEFQEMPKISLFSDEKPYKLEEKIRDLKNEYLKVTQSSHADHKSIKELQDSLKETEIYYEKLLEDKANVNSQLLTTVKSLKDELNSKKIELSPISRQSDIEKSRLTITPLRLTNRSRHGSLDFDAQPFTLREGSGNQLYEKDLKYSQSKTHRRKHSHHHKGKIELSEVLNIVEHIKDEIVGKSFPKKDLTVEAREVFISFSN